MCAPENRLLGDRNKTFGLISYNKAIYQADVIAVNIVYWLVFHPLLAKSAASELYLQAKIEMAEYYKQELERRAAAAARLKPKPKAPEKKDLKTKKLELQERVQKTKETVNKLTSEGYWTQKRKEIRKFNYEEWREERKMNLRRKRKERAKKKSI